MNKQCEEINISNNQETFTQSFRLTIVKEDADSTFDYYCDVDENGAVVFTPETPGTKFDTIELVEECVEDDVIDNVATKCITLTFTMLSDDNNFNYHCIVDDIGQAIILPDSERTSFLTVSIQDSLNLVEELKIEQLYEYTLRNSGDGWDVLLGDDIIEEGFATLAEAKVFVITKKLAELNHELSLVNEGIEKDTSDEDKTDDEDDDAKEESDEEEPDKEEIDTTARVIESCGIKNLLNSITENSTRKSVAIRCKENERDSFVELLSENYNNVHEEKVSEDEFIIRANKDIVDNSIDTQDIILQYLMGNIDQYEGVGKPEENYILLDQLTHDNYKYYFDPESGCIVYYIGA